MKQAITILLLFFAVSLSARNPDSSKFAALGLKLAEYYDAMKHESIPLQQGECDFLIESTSDSLLRQFIAQDIYRHYISSPVMGAENVAVHVFDKWFATGKIPMESPEEYSDARIYADFNRQSLIGSKAPQLEMETIDGGRIGLFGSDDPTGRFRVVYFYDTDCVKCKLETMILKGMFAENEYPVDFYAIYTGDNRSSWEQYVSGPLAVDRAVHMWDPSFDSDFQRKYGVTQTPRIFLVGPDGVILGRGLDSHALRTMLDGLFAEKILEYGTSESETLFDGIFAATEGRPSVGEVKGIADYIYDRTLQKGDTLMFRQMAGDYLYYLASRTGEGFKEGMRYHIDKNIFSPHGVWTSQDDSLKVLGFAGIMSELLSKALPGTVVPPVMVPGELYSLRKFIGRKAVDAEIVRRNKKVRLDRLKGSENIIIFYTEGCEVCAAEKAAALDMLKTAGVGICMVNMDDLMTSDPALASSLMDAFDLSSLPFILRTDRRGIILGRYLSLQ